MRQFRLRIPVIRLQCSDPSVIERRRALRRFDNCPFTPSACAKAREVPPDGDVLGLLNSADQHGIQGQARFDLLHMLAQSLINPSAAASLAPAGSLRRESLQHSVLSGHRLIGCRLWHVQG